VGKIIFMLLTAAIAWLLFKGLSKGLTKKSPDDANRRETINAENEKSKNLNAPERMVKCAHCGVFMPEPESVLIDGKTSCRDPQVCAHGRI
jgi:hypothetical protein